MEKHGWTILKALQINIVWAESLIGQYEQVLQLNFGKKLHDLSLHELMILNDIQCFKGNIAAWHLWGSNLCQNENYILFTQFLEFRV